MSWIYHATNKLKYLYRVLNAVANEPFEEYIAVQGDETTHVAEITKHFLDEHCGDEAPPMTYTLSYYCLQKLVNGKWACCCEEIDYK